MPDSDKTRAQLIAELDAARRTIASLRARNDIPSPAPQNVCGDTEAYLRALFEHSIDATVLSTPDGAILKANPAAQSMFGMTEAEIIEAGRTGLIDQDDARFSALLDERERTGSAQGRARFRRRNGELFEADVSSSLFFVAEKSLTSVIIRDVTSIDRAEQALLENEERFRHIFDNMADGMAVYQPVDDGQDFVFVSLNRAGQILSSVTQEAITGRRVTEVFPGVRNMGLLDVFRRVYRTGKAEHLPLRAYQDKRITLWAENYVFKLPSGLIVALYSDTSAQKIAEQELHEMRAILQAALDQSQTGIAIAEAPSGALRYVNDAGLLIRGGDRKSIVEGVGIDQYVASWQLLDLDGRPLRTEDLPLVRAIRQGEHSSREMIVRRDDNDNRIVWANAAPILDDNGEIIAGIVVFMDITERKKMEEVMVQTEKMMSVGGLAAGMAHEINNPLSGILQNVQVILGRLTQDSTRNLESAQNTGCDFESIKTYARDREIIEALEAVREAGARAAHIVASMLEFSRKSDSGNVPTDLAALLDKTVELCTTDYDLKKKIDFRRVRIEREYSPDLAPVPCASHQIQQVFMNLLRNAAHALSGSDAPKIVLRTRKEGRMGVVEVEDNGIGMDAELTRKIFEPFFTTKPVGEGTGLGLSVSYFIITNNHKGALEVDSQPGKGTKFTIRLPLDGA